MLVVVITAWPSRSPSCFSTKQRSKHESNVPNEMLQHVPVVSGGMERFFHWNLHLTGCLQEGGWPRSVSSAAQSTDRRCHLAPPPPRRGCIALRGDFFICPADQSLGPFFGSCCNCEKPPADVGGRLPPTNETVLSTMFKMLTTFYLWLKKRRKKLEEADTCATKAGRRRAFLSLQESPRISVEPDPAPWEGLRDTPPPQKLELVVAQVNQPKGIALQWTISQVDPRCAPIESFSLFICLEDVGSGTTSAWKRTSVIKALPLPMACSLSQFPRSVKCYVTMRSKDIHGRHGPFCEVQAVSAL
ncbi:hypothetical protein E2320_012295 [Naja naja]|nr:hypothetical protein E2320_012295 [Naja naja]